MDTRDVFDKKLDLWRKQGFAPAGLLDAAIFVKDTLELCKAAAIAHFGEVAPPEITIAIYDRIVQRLEGEHARILSEIQATGE